MARDRNVPFGSLTPGERVLHGESLHYLTRVLRFRSGDTFTAFDPETGESAEATVEETEPGRFVVRLGDVRVPPPEPELVWIHGLAKGDKTDSIVRDATELGATRIGFVTTAFGVPKMDAAKASAKRERWSKIAVEAARQSERPKAPEVSALETLEARLDEFDGDALVLFLHSRGGALLSSLGTELRATVDAKRPVVFVAGPEGGFSDDEVARASSRGHRITSLGPRILRTETVPAAVLGAFWALTGAP